MTNFILSSLATIALTVASLTFGEPDVNIQSQLTEEQQTEIYKQVVDECIIQ